MIVNLYMDVDDYNINENKFYASSEYNSYKSPTTKRYVIRVDIPINHQLDGSLPVVTMDEVDKNDR